MHFYFGVGVEVRKCMSIIERLSNPSKNKNSLFLANSALMKTMAFVSRNLFLGENALDGKRNEMILTENLHIFIIYFLFFNSIYPFKINSNFSF